MNAAYKAKPSMTELFVDANRRFEALKTRLAARDTSSMTHSDVETLIEHEGRDVLRALYQSHLDLRGLAEPVTPPEGADGVVRTQRRSDTSRPLTSLLGPVTVPRTQYERPGVPSLHPVDADLNLPPEKYSLPVRRRVAETAARTSFDATVDTIERTTGASVPKRQAEELVQRAAQDFEVYYDQTEVAVPAEQTAELLVLSTDGKGVVMRPDGLRPATRKAAENTPRKLETRLTKGEKPNRKRMAMVAAVYTIAAWVRTADDVIAGLRSVRVADRDDRPPRPRPEHKRVWASLEREPEQVIDEAFAEALSRDPRREKTWVIVVDGLKSQLDRIRSAARRHGVTPIIVLDFIHALEYLWKASAVFEKAGSREAEAWVLERLRRLLSGQARLVAAAIRRSATKRGLSKKQREAADKCANYLANHAEYMRYDEYLAQGLPIASGVIEGTCRHLNNDRLDITGASWGLEGAEAVLKLRALLASRDFDEYWIFHEQQEFVRNHSLKYAADSVPELRYPGGGRHLRVIK